VQAWYQHLGLVGSHTKRLQKFIINLLCYLYELNHTSKILSDMSFNAANRSLRDPLARVIVGGLSVNLVSTPY
jgi:hypothetical protein